ncbi:class I SAM-dependent methyltransferase [Hyphococcus lacteus]|uniref:Methyltransferase domain-containing protein n=1 Tax=Hyphococcus lacteus TaxID=3143536 RepID=A0ABV3Z4F7_9PROT
MGNSLVLAKVIIAIGSALMFVSGCNQSAINPEDQDSAILDESNADGNVDVWLEQLEVGSRELFSAREAVVAALNLKTGDVVADIGSGTGLYSLMFAEEVGPSGRVYAEDIEPLFLDLVNQRADDAGVDNITAVLGRENNISLPMGVADVVFIADTYHYFRDRQAVMKSVYNSLRPGGALVIVDYDLEEGESRAADKAHVRFGKAGVVSEIEYIGFEFVKDVKVRGLDENYFVLFQKPE